MATESFYEDMVIDTPEAAANLNELVERRCMGAWRLRHKVCQRRQRSGPQTVREVLEEVIPLIDDRGFVIASLSEALEIYGTEWTSEVLGTFRSVHDSATETFLKEKAIDMEIRDLSRTYLAIAKDDVGILGYITLSIKCMRAPDENLLSGKTRKSMNIDSRTNIVQSYLIGQLSRSADAPKGLGGYLLDVAFEKLDQARGIVGCKVVRLDCQDELIDYYKAHGFRLITTNDDRSLNQMMAFIVPKRRMGISKRKSPELLLNALLHHPHLDIEVLVVPPYDIPILPTTTATYSVFGHPSQPFQMLAQPGRGVPHHSERTSSAIGSIKMNPNQRALQADTSDE